MRRLVGGLVCVLLLGGATVSGAQEPASCRWATDTATVPDAFLNGVAAAEPTNVLAVGAVTNSEGRTRTLVRHWDGSSWETQPSANVNTQSHELTDVAVGPNGTAWAVGVRGGAKTKTVVQRYDGSSWAMRASLNPSVDRNMLTGVDVAPSGDVYVVGARWNTKRKFRTIIHRHDGKAWKEFRSDPGVLWDLDVVAEDDIWAVGEKGVGVRSRTFVVHFDGTRWTEMATPLPNQGFSTFFGVSAAGPDDVWAVGEWWGGGGYSDARPWIVHYDGTSWSEQEIPALANQKAGLFGVSALDADTAVAVGLDYRYPVEDSRVVIEWDGTSWTRAEQDGDAFTGALMDVDLTPDGGGWIVGNQYSESPSTEFVSADYVARRTCG
ncbi:MAG TPA: hypothetical protein VG318_05085 [Actinomycetota bacterium]|nr:hypothetical protein [Actinomycetota bacterium]